jgi:hypothetical protein
MIFKDNIITSPEIALNAVGTIYQITFEAGPAVYQNQSEATLNGDALLVEVLRIDGSVLEKFQHLPGAWRGKLDLSPVRFNYAGDGSGPVRLRIGPAGGKADARFKGAITNLVINET